MRQGRKPRSQEELEADYLEQLTTCFKKVAGGCWVWTGGFWGNGYGRIARFRPRTKFSQRAHISSYILYVGPVPKGLFVCHSCDNKACISPKHLWLGTNRQNQIDASQKGAFNKYWTPERRAAKAAEMAGEGNPMHGVRGKDAPCYGRTGKKHPMFGKHHTTEAKRKISEASKLKRHRK